MKKRILKKRYKELEARIAEAERKIEKLDAEMHPAPKDPKEMLDAFMEVLRYHHEHREDIILFRKKLQMRANRDSTQLEKGQLKMPVSQEQD